MKRPFVLLWNLFQRVGHALGRFNSRLILILFFYLIFLPFALIRRAFVSPEKTTGWRRREPLDPKHFEKQF